MTSLYMPDMVVEIAFSSSYATPAASRVWTDVSDYVELASTISITHGRQDERATAEANQLTLTLNNRDGRFTAGLASSPYFPNVKLGRPIRVTATPPGEAASVRFVGYVEEWPVEWPGSDADARATITATSRLSRLGLNTAFRSVVEEEYLYDSPTAYYPMGEPEGSVSAGDVSGNGAAPLVQRGNGDPVTFGTATGPDTDSLTAASFAGGKYLGGDVTLSGASVVTVEAFILVPSAPAQSAVIIQLPNIVAYRQSGLTVTVGPAGVLTARVVVGPDAGVQLSGTRVVADGLTHHAAAVYDSTTGTMSLYVDGTSDGSATAGGAVTLLSTPLNVGGGRYPDTPPPVLSTAPAPFTGTVSHVAVYPIGVPAARFAQHAASGLTGFADETTDIRLARYARWARIAAGEVDPDTGSTTTIAHVDSTDQQVVEMLRLVETTEGGVLFDARDGTLRMHNRAQRYQVTPAVTLSMGAQQVEADYAPRLDRSTLLNDVSASGVGGTVTARVVDQASVNEYGLAAASVESASANPDAPHDMASWLINTYAEPRVRVPTLSVDVLAQAGGFPTSGDLLALDVGSLVKVINQPAQAATSTASYFVEGYTETIGPEFYTLTLNVSPSWPYDSTIILDHATRAKLDAGLVLAY